MIWRFGAGLGATTNLNDGYPMGIWIAFDVVTGTALACGGYAMALLVYVANRGRYHPLVRAALVTSAFGYTLGGVSVLIDIGRAWNFYKIPLFFWEWNFNSILLEVALCIMLYTAVLWIEVSPVFLERWKESEVAGLRRLALTLSPKIEKAMPYCIAVGLLLPTMHQSSLGSLMMLAGPKLHSLWYSPWMPLMFLVSCIAMGYGVVTLECCISSRVFKRPSEAPMLRGLARPIAGVIFVYLALRTWDVLHRGQLEAITRMDGYSILFLAEMGAVPPRGARPAVPQSQRRAALAVRDGAHRRADRRALPVLDLPLRLQPRGRVVVLPRDPRVRRDDRPRVRGDPRLRHPREAVPHPPRCARGPRVAVLHPRPAGGPAPGADPCSRTRLTLSGRSG